MTFKSKITSVEYQESVSRALKNSQNLGRHTQATKKSQYIMRDGVPHKWKSGVLIPLTKIN
jgi:hypothetical protein|tara:strand:+ start:195 stop:377 length:183 start_codon:yes stop_codon:yes gene_type:complete